MLQELAQFDSGSEIRLLARTGRSIAGVYMGTADLPNARLHLFRARSKGSSTFAVVGTRRLDKALRAIRLGQTVQVKRLKDRTASGSRKVGRYSIIVSTSKRARK